MLDPYWLPLNVKLELRLTDQLNTEQVLASGNTLGEFEIDDTVVGDKGVNSPLAGGRVVPILVDLEPAEASHVGLGGTRNLGTSRDRGQQSATCSLSKTKKEGTHR